MPFARVVDLFSILIVILALGVAGFRVYFRMIDRSPETSAGNWERMAALGGLSMGGHWVGPRDAPIVAVVFSDYRCGYCAELYENLNVIATRYPQHLAVVWKAFADPAGFPGNRVALGTECASEQGRFGEYHAAAFAGGRNLTRHDAWRSLAESAGIPDLAGFEDCVLSLRYLQRIAGDYEEGLRWGVAGTPTFVINGEKHVGSPPLERLDSLIAVHLPGRSARFGR